MLSEIKFFKSFYLFIHETQAEGEAGSMQGAPRGTRSWDPRVTPWAEGRRQTVEPPRDPEADVLKHSMISRLNGCGAAGTGPLGERPTALSHSQTSPIIKMPSWVQRGQGLV